MPKLLSVSDVAKKIGCRPRDVSDAFYDRRLDESKILVISNRRLIPTEYLPTIRRALKKGGKLP